MRILHINSNYLYTTLHEKLIEELSDLKVSSDIYMPTNGRHNFVVDPTTNVHNPVCFNKMDRYFYFRKQKKIQKEFYKKFHYFNYTLVHAHTLFTDGYLAYTLNKKYGLDYVVTIRNTDVNAFFKKRVILRKTGIKILLNANKIIFISETYKDQVLRNYIPLKFREVITKKSTVIHNGIDDFWLKNKNKEKEKLIPNQNQINLLFVGRIDKNKNITTTLLACEDLIKKGYSVNFTIVGNIADQREFSKICKYDFVNYIKTKTKEELIGIYRDNHIYVMPSFTETFGLVYAEAMSQGLPVIYTEGQGFDGQFDNGFIGYSVNPRKYNEISKSIIEILNNYSPMSENCINSSDRYSWNEIAKKYLKIYQTFKC